MAGIKDVENLTWKTNYRGKFLIHAPKGFDLFVISFLNLIKRKDLVNFIMLKTPAWFHSSTIIGEAEIIDCVQDSKSIWAESGCWHFVLKNAVLYDKPILNVKGKLNFWEYRD